MGLVDEIDNHSILNWIYDWCIIEIEQVMNKLKKQVVMVIQFSMNSLISNHKIPPLAVERLQETFSNEKNYH